MKPYHKRFKHIDHRTIEATRRLMEGWGRKDLVSRNRAMRLWLDEVTSIYGLPEVAIERGLGDFYWPSLSTIHMRQPSLVTLMHEFRHHYQHHRQNVAFEAMEDDARAWSLSLYHRVAPRRFRYLVENNMVIHLDPSMRNREVRV